MISHSNEPSVEIPLVISALDIIYSKPNHIDKNQSNESSSVVTERIHREKADSYLQSFQRSPVSWCVCDMLLQPFSKDSTLLSSSNSIEKFYPYVYFFAAQTLHSKCRRASDLAMILSNSSVSSAGDHKKGEYYLTSGRTLRESIASHITFFSTNSNWIVTTQLGMALCSLAVQTGWLSIVQDILKGARSGSMNIFTALEIFRCLPEECQSDRLMLCNEHDRYTFQTLLRKECATVIDFVWDCVGQFQIFCNIKSSAFTKEETTIIERGLRCLYSWIRFVDIPPNLFEQTPLVDWIFDIINIDCLEGETFELSSDVVVEILRCYPSHDRENEGLVSRLIPLCMALSRSPDTRKSPFGRAIADEDYDNLRTYCRIFTEMGESYMSLITSFEDLNQKSLVDVVLACSAIPDHEIANITLHFWYRFVSSLEEIGPYEYRQIKIDYFTPQLIQLVEICTSLLRYPENMDTLSSDQLDEIYKDRYFVADTLEDCCRLLGADTVLNSLGNQVRTVCQNITTIPLDQQLFQWYGIESCLFALLAISRYVASDESNVLPYVMSLVPQLPSIIGLKNTVNQCVGKFSLWLDSHGEYLKPILPYLAQCLSEKTSASSAAVAIKELCENCTTSKSLGESALGLYDEIVVAQQISPVLNLKDELEVLEGVCKAVSTDLRGTLSFGNINMFVGRIVQPIGERLVSMAATRISVGSRQVISEIERLTVVVMFLHVSNVTGQSINDEDNISSRSKFLVDLMTQSWPYLDALSQKFVQDVSLAEKLCRLHKHVLRGCGARGYRQFLEPLRIQLARNFKQSHLSPYLYAASICITEYGRDNNYSQFLYEMLAEMSKTTFDFLQSMEDFVEHPDVVEEFFFLAGRMMTYCPQPLVLSPLLYMYLRYSSMGIKQDHKEANRGTLNFLENFFSFGIDIRNKQVLNDPNVETSKKAIESAVMIEGQAIVTNLIHALIGNNPCYRINSSHGSISGILHKLNQLWPSILFEWNYSALSSVPERAKTLFLKELVNSKSREDSNKAVENLSIFCTRNRKMHGSLCPNS